MAPDLDLLLDIFDDPDLFPSVVGGVLTKTAVYDLGYYKVGVSFSDGVTMYDIFESRFKDRSEDLIGEIAKSDSSISFMLYAPWWRNSIRYDTVSKFIDHCWWRYDLAEVDCQPFVDFVTYIAVWHLNGD